MSRFVRPVFWLVILLGAITLGSAVLVSCGSEIVTPPAPAADFSLTVAPTSATVTAGGSGQVITLDARSVNGFAGTVAVAVSGLPAGVTASPTTLSLNAGVSQNFTLTAATTAAAGSATVTFTGTSGSLSHAATLSLTVQGQSTPPPASGDFSVTVSPSSAKLTAGGSGQSISVNAAPTNGFNSTVAVAISGLPSGLTASPASLSLTPGTAQSVTLTAGSSAAAGSSTVTFTGTSGSLSHTATVALTVQVSPPTNSSIDVTTYHYDNARDGVNSHETILTVSNVNATQFGKVGFDAVDGKVDAEPLMLSDFDIGGHQRNVLYVATEHDSVYAFDGDTGAQLWKTSILGSGETPSDDHGCGQITPEIGITSTPVIDRFAGPNGTIFVVGMTKDASGHYHQRLHALDVTTGAELSGSPTEITATYPGTGAGSSGGNVVFDPGQYAERAALLLVNGTIYMGWTSHCDGQPYTGWVMGYSESTLKQTQVLNLTPNGSDGSIWMSGDGIAADEGGGYLYLLDANGTFDTALDGNGFPAKGDFGNAIVKLSTSGKLAVADYFETYNTVSQSNADADMGSGGEILLPPQRDANGAMRNLLVGAGKDTNIYVLDRDNMGKFSASGNSAVYQEVTGALPTAGVRSTPAFFNGVLYYGPAYTQMRAFPMVNAKLATSPSSMTAVSFPYPGATPSVSANGTANGIVWALESDLSSAGVLHAYDATNLAHELYNSNQAAGGRDAFGNGNKFVTPVVVNGKVYVPTQNGVAVFGLLP